MDNTPFRKGHKRNRSTHIPEYFPTKKGKVNHKRQSSSKSNRNTTLPSNRAHFVGRHLQRSRIPSSIKQNPNHRNYHRIPNNKYLIPSTSSGTSNTRNMTSTLKGTVNDVNGLLNKADESGHFFETRLVERTPPKDVRGKRMPPAFRQARMKISMDKEDIWPCYTFTMSTIGYANQPTTHYNMNIGLRNRSVIDIIKATTKFQYKVMSDQSWKCRMIVWTSNDPGPFNRSSKAHAQETGSGREFELLNNIGEMYKTDHSTCRLKWDEPNYASPQDDMTQIQQKSLNAVLGGPLNTKYPSTPFYWSPNDGIVTLFDTTTTIPGKRQHLESEMYEDDTWQKGPGMVEYKDTIGRGGVVTSISQDIKHQKNWHMTLIWQPEGRFSGEPLPISEDNPNNTMELDIIHTVFWKQ